jgi:hypothetical protein
MSICTPNLRHSFFTICEIITFKFFSPVPERDFSVLEAKKTTFSSRFGMSVFRFLFFSELGICLQNFKPTRSVEP